MRKLLFKALSNNPLLRSADNWIYGYYTYNSVSGDHFITNDTCFSQKIDPETLCQFTGLYDKNGVGLYEHDIFDICQTVNGCSKFEVLWYEIGWSAKYAVQMVEPRLYEYDLRELFDLDYESKYPYEVEFEIIGNSKLENMIE